MLIPSPWQRLIPLCPKGVALPAAFLRCLACIPGSVSDLPGSQEHPWSSIGQGHFQPARLRPLTKEQLSSYGRD